jgi:hypothetical protein
MRTIRDEDRDSEDHAPVTIEGVTAEHETERALRCAFGDGRKHWIPKSQITDDSEVYAAGHVGRLVITGWFANKEGIEP